MGCHAPPPRPTAFAALLVALGLSAPVFAVLTLAGWLLGG